MVTYAIPPRGATTLVNAQPLVLNYAKGTLALAHNGNLVNTEALRKELEKTGALFHTTTDSEVLAHCIARERMTSATVEEAIRKAASRIRGAYGLVIASPRKLIGVRDPLGLKPLCRENGNTPGSSLLRAAPWKAWGRSLSGMFVPERFLRSQTRAFL